MKHNIKITADGSHTIYLPELDETYHSVHGAIQEAIHVFIKAGLHNFLNKENIAVLEIGLGTGLNAFLTLLESGKLNSVVDYTALEAFPIKEEVITELNYLKQLQTGKEGERLFEEIHHCKWGEEVALTQKFTFSKIQTKVQDFESKEKFDLIYFDAFGPRVQVEMWEKEVLAKMYNLMKPKGVLVTYCAKGSVKRTLKEVGFKVEALPGPPGKREMTRAQKL